MFAVLRCKFVLLSTLHRDKHIGLFFLVLVATSVANPELILFINLWVQA